MIKEGKDKGSPDKLLTTNNFRIMNKNYIEYKKHYKTIHII